MTTPDGTQSTHLWRVRTALYVPKYTPTPPGGGLPDKLELHSRLPEQGRKYGDIVVAVRKPMPDYPNPTSGGNPQLEHVEVVADVPAGSDAHSAIERLASGFVALVDLIAFEMGTPLGVGPMSVTDITSPSP